MTQSAAGMRAPGKAPLFIIGSPRSGTTFLTHMVNRFLDFHIARDAGVFLRFHRLLSLYGDLAEPGNMRRLVEDMYADHFFDQRFRRRGLTMTADELCRELTDRTYPGLIDHILMATARAHGKTGWGNKRPSYALSVTEVDELFPTAKFVHIIRDGRDVVLSMRKAVDNLFERNWYFAAMDWREHVLEGRRMGRALGAGRYLEVQYESVLRDPLAVFAGILDLVGAGEEEKRRLEAIGAGIRARLKSDNCYKWKRQMPEAAQRIVEQAAGDLLADLGYEVGFRELHGTAFPRGAVWWFQVDRIRTKVFRRSLGKALLYRSRQWLTRGRAMAGGVLGPVLRAGSNRPTSANRSDEGHS